MKSIVLVTLLTIFSISTISGQIKIGDNPQNIDPSSVLELESTSRVLVITRVSTTQMEAIVPQRGGVVYNTDTQCIHYFDGAQWVNLCDAVSFSLTNDPIENITSTISIVDNGASINLEVAPNSIRSENIVDGGINGDDIQDNSIGESKLGDDSVSSNELRDNSVGTSEVRDGSIQPNDMANSIPDQILTTDENGIVVWQDASGLQGAIGDEITITGSGTIANPLAIAEAVQNSIDDNTITIAAHILDDSDIDDQNESLTDLRLVGNNLIVTESGNETTLDLTSLNNSGTDNQTLSLTGNILEIERGNTVNLNPFLDNTDEQTLSIAGNRISLTDGGFVDLPPGTVDTDEQQLSIAGNRISLTDGGFVDLPAGTVNTDNQNLTRTGNTINISGGTGVDLTPILGGGATDGVVSNVTLAGTNLNFTGAGGGFNGSVSLAGLGGGTGSTEEADQITITGVGTNADPFKIQPLTPAPATNQMLITNTAGAIAWSPATGGGADGVITNMALTGTDLVVTGTAPGFNGTIPLGTLGGTADGVISNVTLVGTDLNFTGAGGGFAGIVPLGTLGGGAADGVITNMELTGTDLVVTGTAPGFSGTIPLGTLGGGTDAQQLTLETGNLLTLTNDASPIDLTPFLDNQTAGEVTVTANPANYAAATPNVEAHLAGIDAALLNAGAQNLANVLTTGNSAGNSQINDLLDPTLPQDAATRAYVETRIATILAAGGVDGVITNAFLTGTEINFTGANGGFNGAFDLDPTFTTDVELTNAIISYVPDWANLTNIPLDIADGDNDTQYTAGTGLTLTAGEFAVDATTVAADWANLTNIPLDIADGDNDTQYTAGTGLTLTAGEFAVDAGAIAADWTTLTGIPAGFADDIDNDTNLDEAAVDAFVANNGFLTVEVDGDANNEIQALSILGNDITLSNGGGTITLPAAGNLGSTNQTLNANRTVDINGNELYFTGTGSIGIGNNNPQNKLHVSGEIRSEGFNSSQGTNGAPAYSFSTGSDSDTGMYRPGNNQLGFSTGGTLALTIDAGQNVITSSNLSVGGNISTTISGQVHPDYVFQKYFTGMSVLNDDYKFQSLEEIEKFVKKNNHLPGIKSADQVKKEGSWNLSESNIQNLEKIEELFLHTIEQEKKIKILTSEKEELAQKLESLQKDVAEIKQLLLTKNTKE